VSGLDIEQTIQLRAEASQALPLFREFLASKLSARSKRDGEQNWEDCVAELRYQSEEVRSELKQVTARSGSLQRNAKGILGMGISVLGFAVEGPITALTTLLSTLGLLHGGPHLPPDSAMSATARPGFVLVAAQDILAHATRD
jgi:hypothetical protein